MASKSFDIAVLGATGFTGGVTAAYLAEHWPKNLRLAIAGRNEQKLEAVRQRLIQLNPDIKSTLGIIIAEGGDNASIDALAASTRVLISTVGPFWEHGPSIVEACIRHSTHYLDCTGETHFIRKLIDTLHDRAVASKTVVLPSCAFEAFLPDLGAFLITRHLKAKNLTTGTVRYSVVKLKASGISGGTIHSLSTTLSLDKSILRAIDDNPNCLEPANSSTYNQHPATMPSYYFDEDLNAWQSWFMPSPGNVRYSRRSNALLGYGSNFSFYETLAHGNALMAALAAFGQTLVFALLQLRLVRWLVGRIVPPGTGPSEKSMRAGSLDVKIVGESSDKSQKCSARIRFGQDPGYYGTAVILGESAFCLLLEQSSLRDPVRNTFPTHEGGILTAASGLGATLLRRLAHAGFEMDVSDA
ncbi:Saccharopine dehydrogenase-domain-containing protein [Entophlyctis helioformis]|nr:Saccharopine dehydrogenase-domain-containing protein [Entophlyctis helioformis]